MRFILGRWFNMADIQLARKVDLDKKADKTQVLTNVPANAKFTDTIVDISGKADKSYVDSELGGKVDNSRVLTDVPANAKFTDTIYSHPSSHPASMITGLPTKLPADGGNAATVGGFTVGVNVPANAKFTDTLYTKLSQLTNDKNFIDGAYDNSVSGLTATTIQTAIDELKSLIDGLTGLD